MTAAISQSAGEVILKPRKAGPFWGRHPWVLESAVARIEGEPENGAVVDLVADNGSWIARGIYNAQSRIRVRLYTWDQATALDEAFWRARVTSALELRRQIGYLDGNLAGELGSNPEDAERAARLIYSEADGLSGLVVDRYGPHLVVQPTSLALGLRLDQFIPILAEQLQPRSISVRADVSVAQAEGLTIDEGVRFGEAPDDVIFIREHGIRYGVQLALGQKTGFYLDQRENRLAAALLMRGRRVLDVCCYNGGFGLAALSLGGAKELLGVDASQRAVAMAQANAEINGIKHARFECSDAFSKLDELAAAGERFGAVILDPPKFTRRRDNVDEALRAYHRLNRVAVDLLEPGGILVSCSCSGSVTRADFFGMLFGVALKTHRDLQILQQRGAAPDHPVSVTCPENDYLKCFICRVG